MQSAVLSARKIDYEPALVEPGGVEPPSENPFTRLSTRLVGLLNLPSDSPNDRIALRQFFKCA